MTMRILWPSSPISHCRAVLEAEVEALLGPKTEEDLKPPEKKPKAKAPPKVWTGKGVHVRLRGGRDDRRMLFESLTAEPLRSPRRI